jgi:hypothetical protein
MKRILKLAVAFLLVIYLIRAFALALRTIYNNVQDGKSAFEGIIWKNILLPRFDNGFEFDRIGEIIGAIGIAFLIVKKKIRFPK